MVIPSKFRMPAVAGMFYPADAGQCRLQAQFYLQGPIPNGLGEIYGAIVPHAGWICSGAIAGESIRAVASRRPDADLIVVFGAVHTPLPLEVAALDTFDAWQEPGAACAVENEVRRELSGQSRWFAVNDQFHQREHAVEVVLPMVQVAWPNAKVLPIEVPPSAEAAEIGRQTARAAMQLGSRPVYLASSDLTHYGPAYQFAPAGIGEVGLQWAMENDKRLLDLVMTGAIERIMPEVMARRNACGPGAIVAMMAACREHGAARATLLRHTNSFQALAKVAPQKPDNAVGYAALLLGKQHV
jgi:AmmeMemoRadiSam system protein B